MWLELFLNYVMVQIAIILLLLAFYAMQTNSSLPDELQWAGRQKTFLSKTVANLRSALTCRDFLQDAYNNASLEICSCYHFGV